MAEVDSILYVIILYFKKPLSKFILTNYHSDEYFYDNELFKKELPERELTMPMPWSGWFAEWLVIKLAHDDEGKVTGLPLVLTMEQQPRLY